MAERRRDIALTIAGSDSGGGAGIQADLKTFAALEIYGASVVTALTAQNTVGVQGVETVTPAFVRRQLDSVFADFDIAAVKIGMLSSAEVIDAVADGLEHHRATTIVLDPVMVATSGDRLIAGDAVERLKTRLLPLATIVTPNMPEAAALLDEAVAANEDGMADQACRLLALGPGAVLLKGGHADGPESVDIFADTRGIRVLRAPRHPTRNTHGTGCTLSSAIAARLAAGDTLDEAVTAAKTYVTEAIVAADRLAIGHGAGPLHHFYAWWR